MVIKLADWCSGRHFETGRIIIAVQCAQQTAQLAEACWAVYLVANYLTACNFLKGSSIPANPNNSL